MSLTNLEVQPLPLGLLSSCDCRKDGRPSRLGSLSRSVLAPLPPAEALQLCVCIVKHSSKNVNFYLSCLEKKAQIALLQKYYLRDQNAECRRIRV